MMNVLRRIAMSIGGTAAVALVIGLAAPKTVHAVVSALVTVANTSANPVPTTDVMRSVAQNVERAGGGTGCVQRYSPSKTVMRIKRTDRTLEHRLKFHGSDPVGIVGGGGG